MKHRLCPVCKFPAAFVPYMDKGSVLAICSGNGCIRVVGRNLKEAERLWDERRFSDPTPNPKHLCSR